MCTKSKWQQDFNDQNKSKSIGGTDDDDLGWTGRRGEPGEEEEEEEEEEASSKTWSIK